MNRRWVRVYADILDDQKIDKMSLKSFKFFIFLLVLCAEEGISDKLAITLKDLSWRFRITQKACNEAINELIELNIISFKNNEIIINNWNKRQFKSDSSTERVKRFRNVSVTVNETPPDTDTDTDTDTKHKEKYKKESLSVAEVKKCYDRFYSVYPKKKSPEQFKDTFKKIIKKQKIKTIEELNAFTEKLINAVKLQISEHQIKNPGQDYKYWKYPSSWLNAGAWNDDVDLRINQQPANQHKPKTAAQQNADYVEMLKDADRRLFNNQQIGGKK